jgi:extracellular factor (EF) 3-hydroxypalmitic acid methyl ester biosynthesis protein
MSSDSKHLAEEEFESAPTPLASGPTSSMRVRTRPDANPARNAGQSYADLDGGQGREVYFRPHRYQRQDLGPVRPVVELVSHRGQAGETVHECALHDVSQNGVAFEWPVAVPVETGAIIPDMTVSFDGHAAYAGEGRVGSVRDVGGKKIVGASFTDSLMNIRDVLQLRDVRSWKLSGSNGLGLHDRPWQVRGCEGFKALVGDLRLLLDDASTLLARLESSLPWSVAHGDRDSPARRALIERIHQEFVVEFVRYSEEIDVAHRLVMPGDVEAVKEYSRRQLQDYFMQAPCMHRALYKPLGYPGDYEIMKDMYETPFSGPTLFAKSMSLAVLSTRAVDALRARKDLVKGELDGLLDAEPKGRPLRVLSIAAGPAQEVYELLRDRKSLPSPLDIVLFDQDEGALSYAYDRLKRLVDARWPERVRIVYLHDSIKRLLKDPAIFSSLANFDAIFCCGLFDYLELPTAIALCRNLFANLETNGTLYVGNLAPNNPNRWLMELHLDWFVIYRTRPELLDLARLAAPGARSEILEETTGINPFVCLKKV